MELCVDVGVRTARLEGPKVNLIRHLSWAHEVVGRKLDRIALGWLELLLMSRARFDDQTKCIAWKVGRVAGISTPSTS